MKAGELLIEQLKKAGIAVPSELKPQLEAIEVDIPVELGNVLGQKLMSLDSAKNEPQLKSHFLGNLRNGFFGNIKALLKKNGVSEDELDILFKDDSGSISDVTFSAFEKLIAAKTKGSDSDPDVKKENKRLNDELAAMKEGYIPKAEVEKIKSEWENDIVSSAKKTEFLKQKWSKLYPEDVRAHLAEIKLTEELNKMGAIIVRKDGELKLFRKDNKDLEYFDTSNKNVTFTDLVDHVMTTNKFKDVSGTTDTPTPTTLNGGHTPGADKPKNPNYQPLPASVREAALKEMKLAGS